MARYMLDLTGSMLDPAISTLDLASATKAQASTIPTRSDSQIFILWQLETHAVMDSSRFAIFRPTILKSCC